MDEETVQIGFLELPRWLAFTLGLIAVIGILGWVKKILKYLVRKAIEAKRKRMRAAGVTCAAGVIPKSIKTQ